MLTQNAKNNKKLKALIGEPLFREVSKQMGGVTLSIISNPDSLDREERNEAIRQAYHANPDYQALSIRFGLSERRIREIVR